MVFILRPAFCRTAENCKSVHTVSFSLYSFLLYSKLLDGFRVRPAQQKTVAAEMKHQQKELDSKKL